MYVVLQNTFTNTLYEHLFTNTCLRNLGETKDMALGGHILVTMKGVELERVHQWVWGSQLSPPATIDIASLQHGVQRDRSEDINLDEHTEATTTIIRPQYPSFIDTLVT